MTSRKSLVLVTVDCLRADHVGFMGYQRATTPFLDLLASESFVVPTAIVAGAPTYYSFPAILASRYSLALGRDVLGLAPGEPTLASALKQQGYATAAFGAANPYISSRFGYEQGFDTFRDFLEAPPASLSDATPAAANGAHGWASSLNRTLQQVSHALGPLGFAYDELYFQYCQRVASRAPESLDSLRRFPAADLIVDQALAWLTSVGEGPFFLWLHLMDPHSPYYPTEKGLALMGESQLTPSRTRYLNSSWNRSDLGPSRLRRYRDDVITLYDCGVRWVDAQIERLVGELRHSGVWDNCIFAFTADHGEEFLDHGGRYHPPSSLMEELISVPLLIRVPGAVKREISTAPFSMLHLAPTLLEAADVSVPPAFEGRSRWQQLRQGGGWEETAISECVAGCTNPFLPENRLGPRVLAVRERRFKLVLYFDPPGERLYDLEADPGEHAPLPASAEEAARRRLLERTRDHLLCTIRGRDPAARMQAQLRELRLEWGKSADKALPLVS